MHHRCTTQHTQDNTLTENSHCFPTRPYYDEFTPDNSHIPRDSEPVCVGVSRSILLEIPGYKLLSN